MSRFSKVLLVAIPVFLAPFLAGCGGGAPSEKELDRILERGEQYRIEKYGPPNGEAYRRYFGEPAAEPSPGMKPAQPPTPPTEKIEPVFDTDASPLWWKDEEGHINRNNDTVFVQREREKLRDCFQKNDATLRKIDQALSGGRAWLPWSVEKKTKNVFTANFLSAQIFAKTLRLRGEWAIAEGRPAESIEWFDRALRLGNALCAGKVLISDLVGVALEAIALGGYQTLAWTDISSGTLRDALRRLNALEKDMMLPSTEDAMFFDVIYMMATMLQHAPNDRTLRNAVMESFYSLFFVSREIGSNPALSGPDCAADRAYFERLSLRRTRSPLRLFQLTCRPAFYKRVRQTLQDAPALFRNPVFSVEEMKKMSTPAILILTPAFRGVNLLEAETRAALVRQQYQLTRLAVAARLYRAEKGRDPAALAELAPDYLPTLPKSEFRVSSFSFSFLSTPPPALVSLEPSGFALCPLPDNYFWISELSRYARPRFMNTNLSLSIASKFDSEKTSLALKLAFPPQGAPPFRVPVHQPQLDEMVRAAADDYEKGLKNFPSIVESVEQVWTEANSGGYIILNVRLKRPIAPLAVVSPGPSNNPPTDPPILYDPTNGTRSDGVLTALVEF